MSRRERALALVCGFMAGAGVALMFSAMAWSRVVERYRAEARRSLELAEESREQLLACHQAGPILWALERHDQAQP